MLLWQFAGAAQGKEQQYFAQGAHDADAARMPRQRLVVNQRAQCPQLRHVAEWDDQRLRQYPPQSGGGTVARHKGTAQHPERFAVAVVTQVQQAVFPRFCQFGNAFSGVNAVRAAVRPQAEIPGMQCVLCGCVLHGALAVQQ